MARPEPVVSTGMRQSRGARSDVRAQRASAAATKREVGAGIYARISALLKGRVPESEAAAPKTPYEVVFQSRYRSHRIQIDAPADVIDARGRKTQGKTLFAQFRDSHFSIPKFIKPKDAEFMLDVLRQHPAFNNDFWEEKDNSHEIRVAKVAQVVALLEDKKNADIKDTILDYLSERDFVEAQLGEAPGDAPTIEEIEAAEQEGDEAEDSAPAPRRKAKAPTKPAPSPRGRVGGRAARRSAAV